jgi:hypothetical protein
MLTALRVLQSCDKNLAPILEKYPAEMLLAYVPVNSSLSSNERYGCRSCRGLSVAGRTTTATTADALDCVIFLQLVSRYAAYASALEVRLVRLNTSQAAQLHSC